MQLPTYGTHKKTNNLVPHQIFHPFPPPSFGDSISRSAETFSRGPQLCLGPHKVSFSAALLAILLDTELITDWIWSGFVYIYYFSLLCILGLTIARWVQKKKPIKLPRLPSLQTWHFRRPFDFFSWSPLYFLITLTNVCRAQNLFIGGVAKSVVAWNVPIIIIFGSSSTLYTFLQ